MRLHHLTMTAFGPFAGTETVDFDELATAGLFLFTGPTGAGKTTILDAVGFALYGQVPGARAEGSGRAWLRSDHAAEGVAPQVVLEVTLRGRRLRVSRSPAWERPKRRGAGTVTEHARVLVHEDLDGQWTSRTTRLDEAGLLLGGLLGLSFQQFCQVVLLPQGHFAEFLRADADRRRVLLETLFDTRRFADVEGWLVTRRQLVARELGDLDETFRQLLARVAEAAGEEAAGGLADRLVDEEVADWVDALLARSLAGAEEADRTAKAAALVAEQAAQRLAAGERTAELRRRALTLRARREVLDRAAPERDAALAELDEARRVAPLLPVLAEAGRLQTELEAARSRAAVAHGRLVTVLAATGTAGSGPRATSADAPLPLALPALTVVRTVSRATAQEAATLRVLAEQEAEATRLARQADRLQRSAVELADQATKASDWLVTAPDRRAALEATRASARLAVAARSEASAGRDTAQTRLTAALLRDALRTALDGARESLRGLVDQHQDLRDRLQDLRRRRLAGMAAELAAGLSPGVGCPVCGSSEHPQPARAADRAVTGEAEQSAEASVAAAEAARRSGEEAVARLELDLGAARTVAGGDRPADEIRAALAAADDRLALVSAQAKGLPAAEAACTTFAREHEQWERDKVAHETERRSAAARAIELRADAARLTATLVAARGDDPSISARRERLERTALDLDGLIGHLAEIDRTQAAVVSALARVDAAIAERGLSSADDVACAVRDDDRMVELEAVVRRHDAGLAEVAGQLRDAALTAALGAPATDVAALRTGATEALALRDEAMARAHQASARVRAVLRRVEEVAQTRAVRKPLAERHRLVDGLARLAEGKSVDNALRMSLSAYVLAARLEQVATAATDRLLRMTSGRYSLVHSAQASGGRARGGLTLRVMDAWTGQQRDPGTLSGGETFAASLALALGLADVVAAEAGGALLETLFVDEGFGSLDEDTLDDVMEVLDDLRDGGRTVGIVSHVADLRQRLPAQLRVVKSQNGSHVLHATLGRASLPAGPAPFRVTPFG